MAYFFYTTTLYNESECKIKVMPRTRNVYVCVYKFSYNPLYYITTYFKKPVSQSLYPIVCVSLLVYWIAYKLADFTLLQSAFSPRSRNFPAGFDLDFLCISFVIVNTFHKRKTQKILIIFSIQKKVCLK